MAKLLITGASGFVGQALLKQARLRHECVGLTRSDNALLESDLVFQDRKSTRLNSSHRL